MKKLVLVLLLTFFAFSYAMFQGGFVSWFLFYSFLPFAVYALCLSLYSLSSFKAERVFVHKQFKAGDHAKVNVSINRQRRFPLLYLVVEELLDEEFLGKVYLTQTKKVFFPWFKREFQFEYSIDNLPRGEFQFRGMRMKTGDFLGLVEKELFLPIQDNILVYPDYEELTYLPFESQFDRGTTVANERIQRESSMTVGVREYQPGDRFSWINWKASARRNEFMTKEFEQRKSHDVMVVMDCAANQRFEAVVTFTASILRAILRKGAQVGLLTSSNDRVMIPIRGGELQQQQFFYHLAKLKGESRTSFDEVLGSEAFLARQSNTLLLITSVLTHELIDKVGFFLSRNGTATILLVRNNDDSATGDERSFVQAARSRGIQVTIVQEGEFAKGLSEVNGG